jgi:hypothetical protein
MQSPVAYQRSMTPCLARESCYGQSCYGRKDRVNPVVPPHHGCGDPNDPRKVSTAVCCTASHWNSSSTEAGQGEGSGARGTAQPIQRAHDVTTIFQTPAQAGGELLA